MASTQDRVSGSGEATSGNGRNSAPGRGLAGAFAGSAALRDAAQGVRQAFGAPTCRLGSAAAKASSCSQAAITRMVCRGLGIPFDRFVFLFVLNDIVPDTGHVELADFEIDRGERVIRYCLRTIRKCLDDGNWPGAEPLDRGERQIQMKPWMKSQIDTFLERAEQRSDSEAA